MSRWDKLLESIQEDVGRPSLSSQMQTVSRVQSAKSSVSNTLQGKNSIENGPDNGQGLAEEPGEETLQLDEISGNGPEDSGSIGCFPAESQENALRAGQPRQEPVVVLRGPERDSQISGAVTVETTEGGIVAKRPRQGIQPGNVPGLHCSICVIGPECPEYHEGMVCAFEDRFRDVPTRDINDVATLLAGIVEENVLRLRRARLMEDVLLGGEVDEKTTRLSNQVFAQAKLLGDVLRSTKKVTVEARGEGILTRIFGGVAKTQTVPGVVVSSEPASLPEPTSREQLDPLEIETPRLQEPFLPERE